ncbi:MAG TPA: permease [Ktedonobacteraceae bacterium]
MSFLLTLLEQSLTEVWETFRVVWPYLLLSVFISAAMRRYVSADRVNRWLQKYHSASIIATTSVAVSTPLCSCGGGIAVALSMMAASIPWGPLVAFLIASPLTSPDEVFYSAGLFGWPFALTYVVAAASAGIAGGFLAHYLEGKGWFINQARYDAKSVSSCCSEESSTCCSEESSTKENRLVGYLVELWRVGRRLLLTFALASFLGYFMGNLIPPTWISLLFGSGKGWSIPLAALSGIPFYLNISSSLPIAHAFIAHGATPGAAMAFLLVGAGTSLGAVAGLLTIARWRVVALVIVTLWPVAILFGYLFDTLLAMKLF